MALTPSKINMFTFMKLPSAWWCGVRLQYIDEKKATTTVKHKWINQNPFKSMFWAVQGMAAELSTCIGDERNPKEWQKSIHARSE